MQRTNPEVISKLPLGVEEMPYLRSGELKYAKDIALPALRGASNRQRGAAR